MGGLPITDFTVGACDEFSPRPQMWIIEVVDGVHYQIAGMTYSGLAFWTCFSDLASAVATADITPGEPSFAARCAFCTHYAYLCSQSCAISGALRHSTDSFLWLWLKLVPSGKLT